MISAEAGCDRPNGSLYSFHYVTGVRTFGAPALLPLIIPSEPGSNGMTYGPIRLKYFQKCVGVGGLAAWQKKVWP